MNDVTVVTSVTYPSPESLALVADVQYHEPYLSAALNRKFRGIVDPGFYAGFFPKPGGGMNLLITSVDGDKTAGAASVNIGEFYQVTIQQRKDISLALSAGKKYAIVLKGRYLLGEDSYQVNTASHIHAAEFVARTYTDSYQLGDGELLVCTVNIPAGVSAITKEMIDVSDRIDLAIGIEISDSVTSTRSDVAASSLAVKKAYDLAKSKYTAQDASTTQKGLVQLSSATNSDSETMAATPKAVKSVKELADTKAPIESPSLTGTPTAPTAAQGTNSTQIANTAFVKAAVTALINGAPGTLDTLKEIAAAINNDPNFSTTINNALALKAPLASPALTGIPTAPTAAQGTNNTQIATTAYVRAAISALVGSSPEALDTLNELAAALGNDPNFATTMTNALAGKQPLDATLTALAGLATGANKLPYFTGTDTVSQTDLTSVGRDILAKTSTLAVIQYLGLREIGTSGEKIPLLSTANTWSSQQTFKGKTAFSAAATFSAGIAGAIEPEAIDGRAIDLNDLIIANTEAGSVKYYQCKTVAGGANITNKPDGVSGNFLVRVESIRKTTGSDYANMQTLINSDTKRIYVRFVVNGNWTAWSQVVVSGWGQDVSVKSLSAVALSGSLTGNASTATKLQTARTIGGVSFDGSANIDLPGVNKAGNQSTTGNAATATKLQTVRTIGGVSFDGSANIDLPGVNKAGNQSTTGNAATATKLQTARTINGVKFDGSANISIPTITSRGRVTALTDTTQGAATGLQMYEAYNNSYPTAYGNVLHMKGASAAGEGELLIGWSGTSGAHAPVFIRSRRDHTDAAWSAWAQVYTSRDSIPGVNATGNQNTTGNAATATKLQTARTIGGVSFDGTANINLPGVNVAGNQNTSGNAATATKLQTARTINGVLFDGSKNIELTPRSIGTINSTTMSFSGGTGWFKLATVTMPQSSSVVYISLIGGSGYNVNSPMQAGISELVLRAGNGNPKGLTGALWRRTSVGFTNFAWVNTSGDTYDVYVEIGNYTTRVNIQWDYTSNASVTIHTSPSYTANKPTGLTDGTVYVIYSSHIKPTATDVGALPITGGNLNGGLTATGEIISKSANGLRIAYGNYGFFIRNDGSNTYFMLTNSGNSLGTYNNLRPLIINNANGTVTIGNGLNVTGGINGSLNGNAATATKLQTVRTIGGVSFDGSANIDLPGVNKTGNQSTTGNAATATKLQTARTIGGVSFDGSANIDLPGVNKAGNQSTTGNAATATKLQTARTINGVKFDGSANITLTAANLGLSDSSGYVGRLVNTRVFTSSGTYTPTPGTKRIRVTITGGGGGGGGCQATSNNETFFGAGGGAGGTIISIMTPTQNSYPVTIGAGGGGGVGATNGLKGGDSSFGTVIAPGGEGGGKVGVTNTNGGNGGAPNTGDVRIIGGHGGDGQSGNISVSGEGGSSFWGGGGRAGAGGGVIGRAYGSGGGGAYDAGYSGTSMTGGKGAAGICIIEEFA
ncbi:TPA: tail fiber protein [Escherichia coli]|uniref:phage tail fiber protein n=2 Tax=Escherichia coli TaxID=562 RepID=UPI0018C38AA9|nr:tail fiber protein [Escherichia coli]EKD2470053.1 tail fiber protein [Escherichia coli]EKR0293767.1 tail fiber protein [Escherichia coli]ELA5987677.1 tail fiber protein [Escherichia coli]MBL0412393.1 tail fiber protein [Escherichia coli]